MYRILAGLSSSSKLSGREVKTSALVSKRSWVRIPPESPVEFFHVGAGQNPIIIIIIKINRVGGWGGDIWSLTSKHESGRSLGATMIGLNEALVGTQVRSDDLMDNKLPTCRKQNQYKKLLWEDVAQQTPQHCQTDCATTRSNLILSFN